MNSTRCAALNVMVAVVTLWLVPVRTNAIELQKLTENPPVRGHYFGARVALRDGVALIGAPSANLDLATVTGGQAHVFRYDGARWIEEQILHPSPGRAVSAGLSVALDGAVAVVAGYENGACTELQFCVRSAAYVYRYNYETRVWTEEQKLVPLDTAPISLADWQEQLGPYVSVDGNVIVLGIHSDASRGPNTGAAYVYRFDGDSWVQEQKLMARAPAADDWFGLEVAVNGDVVVVGAFADTVDLFLRPGVRSGSAHVFRYDGKRWNSEQILAPYFDGKPNDLFGTSVSISGDVILVGANLIDDRGEESGAAYVFRYNKYLGAWLQEQKLEASDGTAGAEFGRAVSLDGGVALIAAYRDNALGFRSGTVYVFRYVDKRWVEEKRISASDARPGDRFGRSLSLSGDVALICAYRKDDACPADSECDSGAAYLVAID